MKGGTAAIVVAAERVAALGEGAAGLELVLCAGEETGCEGALALAQDGALGRGGAVLVAEPTTNYPCVAHKGVVWADAVARGKTAHGSMPHLGENAIYKLARAVARLEDFALEADEHALLGLPTVSLGTMSGGININSVPDYATAGIDVRTVPGMGGDAVLAALRERLGDEVELEPRVVLDAIDTDPGDEWVREVFEVMAAADRRDARAARPRLLHRRRRPRPRLRHAADDHLRPRRRRAGPPHGRVVLGGGARGERRGPVRDRPPLVRALALAARRRSASGLGAAPARADWSGDTKADVLAVDPDGRLLMYRGTGAGAFVPGGGAGDRHRLGVFTALLAPGDWSGDGRPDLLARTSDGLLLLYRGNGSGGFIGGERRADRERLAVDSPRCSPRATGTATASPTCSPAPPTGKLLMYRGNGRGGFLHRPARADRQRLAGLHRAARAARLERRRQARPARPRRRRRALHVPRQRPRRLRHRPARADRQRLAGLHRAVRGGDWSGDGKPDLLARDGDGLLFMYRGNGRGGFVTGQRERIGSGWQGFTALFGGGDFSGDGRPDIVARDANGLLFMYRGNGRGGFVTGQREQIGSGWSSLGALTLVWDPSPAPPRPLPPRRRPPRSREGSARIKVTKGCTRPGGRLKVRVRIRRRAGPHPAARAVRRLLRARGLEAGGPPAAVRRAAADEPARRQARARARAGLLPARGLEEAAAQDGVEAVQDVQARTSTAH